LHGLALVVAGVDLHAVGVALSLFRGGQLDVVNGALNGGVGVARDGCDGGNEVEVGLLSDLLSDLLSALSALSAAGITAPTSLRMAAD